MNLPSRCGKRDRDGAEVHAAEREKMRYSDIRIRLAELEIEAAPIVENESADETARASRKPAVVERIEKPGTGAGERKGADSVRTGRRARRAAFAAEEARGPVSGPGGQAPELSRARRSRPAVCQMITAAATHITNAAESPDESFPAETIEPRPAAHASPSRPSRTRGRRRGASRRAPRGRPAGKRAPQ